jgi:hypothetical protein
MEQKSNVDYVVSMSDIYFKLIGVMKKSKLPQTSSQSGMIGMSWASTGGEASALFNDKYLAADGIENVIRVLDEIETGHFPMLQFVELNACPGGCVGGVATVENPYIARVRMRALRRYLPVSLNRLSKDDPEYLPKDMLFKHELEYRPVGKFDEDRALAMQKMSEIEALAETLPALDCGSCGAPTCRAFAEDVVLADGAWTSASSICASEFKSSPPNRKRGTSRKAKPVPRGKRNDGCRTHPKAEP